jgi:hypothetical protein
MARFSLPHWIQLPTPAAPAYQPDPADLGTELGLEACLGGTVPAPTTHSHGRGDTDAPGAHVEDVLSHYGV